MALPPHWELGAGATISQNVQIWDGTIIGAHTHVKMEAKIGYYDVLDVTKRCNIGQNCLIGIGAIIYMGATIGNNVIIEDRCIVKADAIIDDGVTLKANSIVPVGEHITSDTFIFSTDGQIPNAKHFNHIGNEGANFTIDLVAEGNADGKDYREITVYRISDGQKIQPGIRCSTNSIEIDLGNTDFPVNVYYAVYK